MLVLCEMIRECDQIYVYVIVKVCRLSGNT